VKVGLIDVDSHGFPNLPLMKISAFHKSQGDTVEFVSDGGTYDRVYISKVFTESREPNINFHCDEVRRGGSGYDLKNRLPDEIEHQCPDYSLYPQFDFALGFLTRGCPRCNHTFCITPEKDGAKSKKVADLSEFWTSQKKIVLLDQNILACKDRIDLLQQLVDSKAKVEFNGGIDVRLLDQKCLNLLNSMKIPNHYFAWDDPREDLRDVFTWLRPQLKQRDNDLTVYVLVNYWSTIEEDLKRIYWLRDNGFSPYVMIYDKQKFVDQAGNWLPDVWQKYDLDELIHFKICHQMQRWCNNRFVFNKVKRFEEYFVGRKG